MLITSNDTLKQFPKFFHAKVHLQYKQAIYKGTNHNHSLEWISNSKFSPNESKRKVLTEHI